MRSHKISYQTEYLILNEYLQNRLYKTESSLLIVSQPSPLLKGLLAFQMARRYLISNIEKTTNLKNAAVAKALNKDSACQEAKNIQLRIWLFLTMMPYYNKCGNLALCFHHIFIIFSSYYGTLNKTNWSFNIEHILKNEYYNFLVYSRLDVVNWKV